MSTHHPLLQQLSGQLAQEEKLLRQFLSILQHEHRLLETKNLDQLESTVKEKQTALDSFNQAVRERMDTLSQLAENTPPESESTTLQLIQRYAEQEPAILSRWQELESLLAQCLEQNAINGAVIEVSSHSLKTAYSILTAKPMHADLYDAKGNSRKGGGTGNTLAKA